MSYNLRLLSVINVFNVVPFKLTFLVFDSILFSSDSLLLFATFCCYYYSPHVLPPPTCSTTSVGTGAALQ